MERVPGYNKNGTELQTLEKTNKKQVSGTQSSIDTKNKEK
jgi:hypothetical protein